MSRSFKRDNEEREREKIRKEDVQETWNNHDRIEYNTWNLETQHFVPFLPAKFQDSIDHFVLRKFEILKEADIASIGTRIASFFSFGRPFGSLYSALSVVGSQCNGRKCQINLRFERERERNQERTEKNGQPSSIHPSAYLASVYPSCTSPFCST